MAWYRAWHPRLVVLVTATTGSAEIGRAAADDAMVRADDRWDRAGHAPSIDRWVVRTALRRGRWRRRLAPVDALASWWREIESADQPAVQLWRRLEGLTRSQREAIAVRELVEVRLTGQAPTAGPGAFAEGDEPVPLTELAARARWSERDVVTPPVAVVHRRVRRRRWWRVIGVLAALALAVALLVAALRSEPAGEEPGAQDLEETLRPLQVGGVTRALDDLERGRRTDGGGQAPTERHELVVVLPGHDEDRHGEVAEPVPAGLLGPGAGPSQ